MTCWGIGRFLLVGCRKCKRPGLLKQGVTLQQDNATPHTANRTKDWFARYGWEILLHPPHSLDLAPSDYHLFGPLRCHLGGKKFEEDDDLIEEVKKWFKSLDANFFRRVYIHYPHGAGNVSIETAIMLRSSQDVGATCV